MKTIMEKNNERDWDLFPGRHPDADTPRWQVFLLVTTVLLFVVIWLVMGTCVPG